ncbi:MAG: protein kinase, partial [Pseudomonadales bacterium]|nr:protein kinase [Pseudomonadales bacterium]
MHTACVRDPIAEDGSLLIKVAGYEIEETLSVNSVTIVCRGRRLTDQKRVILKALIDTHPTAERLARFKSGFEVLHKFEHPCIIKPVHWVAPGSSFPYPVMILDDFGGTELLAHLQRQNCQYLSIKTFFSIAMQLVGALSEIHQKHVIHRDLHPANIAFDPFSGRVQIFDFDMSSCLSREQPALDPPDRLEGRLHYLSPEQTGRMNRLLDYRCDFYSLGATFFHLLTGKPPFQADDALGLVYAHLAQRPPSVRETRPDIPEALARVIGKLLAKSAEDRYQSAQGLKADLERVESAFLAHQELQNFNPGAFDNSGKLLIPQKLYGREEQTHTLLRCFLKAAGRNPVLLVVSGNAGIGKSALVNELHKPIAEYNGLFCAGKFESLRKNIPYYGIQTALGAWFQWVFSRSEVQLSLIRAALLS